jgi:hypothetical protein
MTLEQLPIDYQMLADACRFYKAKNYEQIEVPWHVSPAASLETAQINSRIYITNCGEHFIGSAEQGFIELMMNDIQRLKFDTRYFAVSPCFRRDYPDDIHSRWFVKLELFKMINQDGPLDSMNEFIEDARTFFCGITQDESVEKFYDASTQSVDLMHHNLELGSYGYRTLSNGITWVYGTGLALPRTQLILNRV